MGLVCDSLNYFAKDPQLEPTRRTNLKIDNIFWSLGNRKYKSNIYIYIYIYLYIYINILYIYININILNIVKIFI